jgi:hypothetical protein
MVPTVKGPVVIPQPVFDVVLGYVFVALEAVSLGKGM